MLIRTFKSAAGDARPRRKIWSSTAATFGTGSEHNAVHRAILGRKAIVYLQASCMHGYAHHRTLVLALGQRGRRNQTGFHRTLVLAHWQSTMWTRLLWTRLMWTRSRSDPMDLNPIDSSPGAHLPGAQHHGAQISGAQKSGCLDGAQIQGSKSLGPKSHEAQIRGPNYLQPRI